MLKPLPYEAAAGDEWRMAIRPVEPQPTTFVGVDPWGNPEWWPHRMSKSKDPFATEPIPCPYFRPGDTLRWECPRCNGYGRLPVPFPARGVEKYLPCPQCKDKGLPSNGSKRVTRVGVKRLQPISTKRLIAAGLEREPIKMRNPLPWDLWDAQFPDYPWDSNPWCFWAEAE